MENEFKLNKRENKGLNFNIEAFKAANGLNKQLDVPPKVVEPQAVPTKANVSPEQSFFSLLKFVLIVIVICYIGFMLYYTKISLITMENMQRTEIEHQQRYEMKKKLFEESGIY